MFELSVAAWEIVVRTVVVYAVVLGLLRVAGKRELGQMTAFDLVVILVISNAVQNAMTGGDNSLAGGIIAAVTLVAVNVVVGRVERRLPFFARAIGGSPTLLLRDGKFIDAHLERENVTTEEVAMAAREHGIGDVKDVSAAILEIDGSISVIPKEGATIHRSTRRIRQLRQRP